MDRLLLISTVFFLSICSMASTKGEIRLELKQAEASQARLYQKIRVSMGEPTFRYKPRARHKTTLRTEPAEYKIQLIKKKVQVAKTQKR